MSKQAHEILQAGAGHLEDRADDYDSPGGERSMAKTVAMFNTLADKDVTEREGWLFMAILKMVRSMSGPLKLDSYEDAAAYMALSGETSLRANEESTIK